MTSPFHHEARQTFTPQQRARIYAERGGRCGCPPLGEKDWGCGRKLGPADKGRVEHSIALENGGTNDSDNLWVCCSWCWPEKDADDHAMAAHSRGAYTKHVVPKQFQRSRAWGRR